MTKLAIYKLVIDKNSRAKMFEMKEKIKRLHDPKIKTAIFNSQA